jgi:hypothetical protein
MEARGANIEPGSNLFLKNFLKYRKEGIKI